MQNVIVYVSIIMFALALLPVYANVYVYADSGRRYFSAKVLLWKFIPVVKLSTAENGKMRLNGNELKIKPGDALSLAQLTMHNVNLFKLIQLGDFGIQSNTSAYLALLQYVGWLPPYNAIKYSGRVCKLKNYVILNCSRERIVYCAKAVCAINLIAAIKILILMLKENVNEI